MIDVWVTRYGESSGMIEKLVLSQDWDGRDGFWSGTNMARTMMGPVGLT